MTVAPEMTAAGESALQASSAERARPQVGLPARARLVLLSFLMLFVELALIRWTAANNVYLAPLTNYVLLASFLGIGIGFLRANSRRSLLPLAPVALAVLVAFVLAFPVSIRSFGVSHLLHGARGLPLLPEWASISVVFLLVAATMATIGQETARSFGHFRPLEAYRLDILGSLLGIGLFSALSFLWLPPIAWGALASLVLLWLLWRRLRIWQIWAAAVSLATVLVLLGIESASPFDQWSPYYKVSAIHSAASISAHGNRIHDAITVWANNIPHQTAYPISTLRKIEPFYFYPYRHVDRKHLRNVLIVGAGTGNDVAVALSEGAHHIDAVEIDPVILNLGRRWNPDRAYQSRRVSVHINDGRAFIQNTNRRYDLILFALPDSLTLITGQSNLRIDNYLFTLESIQRVRSILEPGGTFAMYNYYGRALLDRYATTLTAVFGNRPCEEIAKRLAGRRQVVLSDGAGARRNCARPWNGRTTNVATDDWPFPYLVSHTIPSLYLRVLAFVLAGSLLLVWLAGGAPQRMGRYLDLFCMGAAFSLLETKNVVQFALLFGSTWFVNSLVFAGVLLSIYLAVEVARHVRLPRPHWLYLALIASLAVAFLLPQASLLALAPTLRFVCAAAVAFAPIFCANLVFAQRFQDVSSSTVAFGANLLGAILGGAIEYVALISGYRFLLVIVGILYALAFALAQTRALRPAA